eukprot:763151-Hanusia_phi.AAC.1
MSVAGGAAGARSSWHDPTVSDSRRAPYAAVVPPPAPRRVPGPRAPADARPRVTVQLSGSDLIVPGRYGHWPVRGDPAMEVTVGWTGYGRIILGPGSVA